MSIEEINVHVRTATPEDEDGIMALAHLVNAENGVFKMNDEKVRALVRPSLHQQGGIMGVIGPKDNLEGLILLRVANYWYADEPFLEEMCVFVHPDFRAARGGRASRLIEFGKKASDEIGLPLMMGVLSNSRTNAKEKLYERHLGAPSGYFFLYGIKTGAVKAMPDIVT